MQRFLTRKVGSMQTGSENKAYFIAYMAILIASALIAKASILLTGVAV